MKNPISKLMHDHYDRTFSQHGCTSQGVDWGAHSERAVLRQHKILEVVQEYPCSLLDVGCGYGALLDEAQGKTLDYTGIDLVQPMVEAGKKRHSGATFICGDVLTHNLAEGSFDYVVCNGILTLKVGTSIAAMDVFSKNLIRRMFSLCRKGIAFNMMSTHVNFMAENLFYKSPVETLAWVLSELSPHVRLDQSYPLYEYMVYVYKASDTSRHG